MYKNNQANDLVVEEAKENTQVDLNVQGVEKNNNDYDRVKSAVEEKGETIKRLFKEKNIEYPPREIYLRAFKEEKVLELWARPKDGEEFSFVKAYEIAASSGVLGPKRQEGDKQVPEGFYYIDRFNPKSNYYLSLRINYPNESDSILGVKGRLGGNIFIHGSTKTVGCIPITDDKIKELYIIAWDVKNNGQRKIPVHIFPKKLDDKGFQELKERFKNNKALVSFWENIKIGYDYFEEHRKLPVIRVDSNGRYIFTNK